MAVTRRSTRRRSAPAITWEVGAYPASGHAGDNSRVVLLCAGRSLIGARLCPAGSTVLAAVALARDARRLAKPVRLIANSDEAVFGMVAELDIAWENIDIVERLPNVEQHLAAGRAKIAADLPPAGWWLSVGAWEVELVGAGWEIVTRQVGLTFGPGDRIHVSAEGREFAFAGLVVPGDNMPSLAFARSDADLDALAGWRYPDDPAPASAVVFELVSSLELSEDDFGFAHSVGMMPDLGVVPTVLFFDKDAAEPVVGRTLSADDAGDMLLAIEALFDLIEAAPASLAQPMAEHTAVIGDDTLSLRIERSESTVLPVVPDWLEGGDPPGELTALRIRLANDDDSVWREFDLHIDTSVATLIIACADALAFEPTEFTLLSSEGDVLVGGDEADELLVSAIEIEEYPIEHLLHLVGDGSVLDFGAEAGDALHLRFVGYEACAADLVRRLIGGAGSITGEEFDLESARANFDATHDELDEGRDTGDGTGGGAH